MRALIFLTIWTLTAIGTRAGEARVIANLSYVSRETTQTDEADRQALDLYLPAATGAVPVIIWIHGGGWSLGDRQNPPALPLVSHGFAVASIGYRLSQQAPFPAQIADCKAAVRWLRAHAAEYGLDPARFGVWGASAGGHLAALLGTSGSAVDFETGVHLEVSSSVQAVCDWCGPTDFTRFFGETDADPYDGLGRMFTQLLAGPLKQRLGLAARANPIAYIEPGLPPFLVMHGSADSVVPLAQSQLLVDALRANGNPVEFDVLPGAQHAFWGAGHEASVLHFFQRTLARH